MSAWKKLTTCCACLKQRAEKLFSKRRARVAPMEIQVVAVDTDTTEHVSTVSTVSALDGSTSRDSSPDLSTDSGYSASGDESLDLGVEFASSYLSAPLDTVRGLYPELVVAQIVGIVRDVLASDFPAGSGERGGERASTSSGAGAERPESLLQLEVPVVRKAFDLVVREYSDILLGSHVLFLTRLIGAVSDHIEEAAERVPHDLDSLVQQLDEAGIDEYGEGTEEHLERCLREVCALLPSLSSRQIRSVLMELLAKVSHVVQECIVTKLLSAEEETQGQSAAEGEALDQAAPTEERPKDILDCGLLQLCQVRINQVISLICTVVDRVLLDGADSQGPKSEGEHTHSQDARTLFTVLSTAFRTMATSDPSLETRRGTQWIFEFFNFVIEPICWLSVAHGFDQVHEFSKLSISRRLVCGALHNIFSYQPGLSDEVILRAAERTLERQLREDDSPPLEELSCSVSEETVDASDSAEELVENNHKGAEESNSVVGPEAHTSEFGQTETPIKDSIQKVMALVYPTVLIDPTLVDRLHQQIRTAHTGTRAPLDSSTLHVRVYNHMCDEWLRSARGPSRGDPSGEQVEELIVRMFLKNLSEPQKKPCCFTRICGRVLGKLHQFLCCFAPDRNRVRPVNH